jgi:two-component system NtrC family sensor kinase
MSYKFSIPLFWKFTIAIVVMVAVFGSINLYFINFAVYNVFKDELIRHGKITATSIAERSVDPIIYDDLAELNKIVTNCIRIDSNIAYIFILKENKTVLAHTFQNKVPQELIAAHPIINQEPLQSIMIKDKNNPEKIIRDMIVPIIDGNLGAVRIGLYEENFFLSMSKIVKLFFFLVMLFLLIGILGAFFFSFIITMPIKILSKTAENLNLNSLNSLEVNKYSAIKSSLLVKWKNVIYVQDEIDMLIVKFDEMIFRLKNTYKELQSVQASLIQSEKIASLGTLSAGLAHEINNPIAGIKNCLRRMSESPDKIAQNIVYIEMMMEAVNRIEKVVLGLLNYSRKQELIFETIDLYNIIENVLLLASFQLEKSRIAITKKIPNKPILIKGSANHLEQIVLNLILNSVDAIDEKKMIDPEFIGEIQFLIHQKNKMIDLEIVDNGIGVPENKLNVIFDPFYTEKKIRQGTGLGLAVAKNIIEQHNGKIIARSQKNNGLNIIVSIPCIQNL